MEITSPSLKHFQKESALLAATVGIFVWSYNTPKMQANDLQIKLAWFLTLMIFSHAFSLWKALQNERVDQRKILKGFSPSYLQEVSNYLKTFESWIETGQLPPLQAWSALKELPEPWGTWIHHTLSDLSANGCALQPTLLRLRSFLETTSFQQEQALSRLAPAYAQAFCCGAMVPSLSIFLYGLLPKLSQKAWLWWGASSFSLGLGVLGAMSLFDLAASSRRGGLSADQGNWPLWCELAGEQWLAGIRAGDCADLSWSKTLDCLEKTQPQLNYFLKSKMSPSGKIPNLFKVLLEFRAQMQKLMEDSLLSGTPVFEKGKNLITRLRLSSELQVNREIELLPHRAMKPLFLWIAPAVLFLVVFALILQLDLSL